MFCEDTTGVRKKKQDLRNSYYILLFISTNYIASNNAKYYNL
jgi:hypothetical protein